MRKLKIKVFIGSNINSLEADVNTFMENKGLLTEDFIDLKVSASGVTKKDKDGEAVLLMVLVYRKENGNGQ